METKDCGLLIVGAGHAGSELAIAARRGGWRHPIVLLGEEDGLPYHRPPLSKAYMMGQATAEDLLLRPAQAYESAGIERLAGRRAVSLDRAARCVVLDDGTVLHYQKLALCMGGRPRQLVCPGLDLASPPTNLFYLRTRADASAIRASLHAGTRLLIVGAGYVGLELAASARRLDAQVMVIEAQQRVLARVAGPEVSAFYEQVHRFEGVDLRLGAGIERFECAGDRIVAVILEGGQREAVDVVVAGIGMVPNVELATQAGLAGADGIVVDALGRTADPDVVAAGDCTVHGEGVHGQNIRIESVPNALEQARAAASWLCDKPRPNYSVPWFWSDQYDLKLQMAGLAAGHDQCVLRGTPASRSFCAFYLKDGRLLAIDAVNRPREFMIVRRALAEVTMADPDLLGDDSVPLADALNAAR